MNKYSDKGIIRLHFANALSMPTKVRQPAILHHSNSYALVEVSEVISIPTHEASGLNIALFEHEPLNSRIPLATFSRHLSKGPVGQYSTTLFQVRRVG